MINIASTPSLAWSSPPAVSVAPVASVHAVNPVQAGARDSRTGPGFGQSGQPDPSPRTGRPASGAESVQAAAAPLLPRSQGEAGDEPVDASELAEAEKRQAEEQAQELAKEQAVQQQLREVLSNVWQASAAVVERALAEGDSATPPVASTSSADAADAVVGAAPLADSAVPAQTVQAAVITEPVRTSEPEAYDEHGHSSWSAPEVGGLVDQRV
jgi:hypothetical protein